MEYVSGDITNHDWEMENVEWLPESEVEKRLTYPSDKKVWQEASKLI
jgi:NADH pyrophosphatase NudC (nudix superfamily)